MGSLSCCAAVLLLLTAVNCVGDTLTSPYRKLSNLRIIHFGRQHACFTRHPLLFQTSRAVALAIWRDQQIFKYVTLIDISDVNVIRNKARKPWQITGAFADRKSTLGADVC